MVDRGLIPEFERNRKLQSIESSKPMIETVSKDQFFGQSEFRITDGEELKVARADIFAELAAKHHGT